MLLGFNYNALGLSDFFGFLLVILLINFLVLYMFYSFAVIKREFRRG